MSYIIFHAFVQGLIMIEYLFAHPWVFLGNGLFVACSIVAIFFMKNRVDKLLHKEALALMPQKVRKEK
jgi:hypothetical protein